MADFDPDEWMKKQGQVTVKASSSFDPDAWMSKQAKPQPQRRPATVLPQDRQQFRQPRLGFENPRGIQPAQPRSLGTAKNLGLGAEQEIYGSLAPSAVSGLEALGSAMTGDFGPAKQIGETALRGAGQLLMGGNPSFARPAKANEAAIRRIQAQRQERRVGDPIYGAIERARQEVETEAAQDPSLRGRVTRGVGRFATAAAPAVVTGIASGGSIPAVAGMTALQSLDQPENMALNVGMSALPAPAAVRAARGLRGRTPARQAAPEVRATQRLPQPNQIETAPTARLPVRERINEMPQIYDEPIGEFGVSENLNPARQYAGAQGPRAITELAFRPQPKAATPPGKPPLQPPTQPQAPWPRPPQQQPLFKGAPASSQRTPPLEVVSALRKAGLLTGIKTHLRNIGGNLAFQPAEEISRIPASLIDLGASVFTGRRTITGPSATAVAKSAQKAATEGIQEAGQILKSGLTNKQAQALQLSGEINSGNRILDAYINGTFRVLGGEDAVFRKYALTRAVQDRARAQALTEARRGRIKRADINTRAKQIAASPDARLMTDAIFDSEVAVFSNQNLPNKFLSAGREKLAKSRAGRAVNFGVDILLPFTKTPTNIIARMLDYSGVGFGGQVAKAIVKRSFTAEQQRQFATTFGRGATGGSLMLLGYKLYQAGLMTGLADDDPGLRNRDVAAGRTPGAILNPETGTWHQVSAFSPLGSLLAIGATLARESEQERKDESKRAEKIAAAGMQTIAQQPMLTGAKEVSEAITRPGTTGERAGRIAGSFVPTLVSDIGELTDSTRREGRGFVGQMQKRVPFARTSLPAATDVLGKPLEDRKTAFFDPTLTSTARDKSDPLMSELTRLNVGLTAPRKFDDETPEDYRARKAQTGQRFEKYGRQLVESQKFKTATKERQKAAVERLLKNIRDTSDEATPDSYQFSPGGLFEAVVAAEFRRKASTAKK